MPAKKTPVEEGVNITNELKVKQTNLRLHLVDGTAIEGTITRLDPYNLLVTTSKEKEIWIPKHAVAYAELL